MRWYFASGAALSQASALSFGKPWLSVMGG